MNEHADECQEKHLKEKRASLCRQKNAKHHEDQEFEGVEDVEIVLVIFFHILLVFTIDVCVFELPVLEFEAVVEIMVGVD